MDNSTVTAYSWTFLNDRIPVSVLKCGSWNPSCEEKSLFFIVPGNPGSMRFYQTFGESLFAETGIPVWGISHTGHVSTPKNLSNEQRRYFAEHPEVEDCGLSPQIAHKILFLQNEVLPKVDKVFLIGHSIGCYIILHILHRMDEPKLYKGIMLFPTIERMAVSPKGKWMAPILVKWRAAISLLAWSLGWLPFPVKKYLVDWLFKAVNEPSKKTLLEDVISPKVADCSSYMGMEEMLFVEVRDDDIIKVHADKLHFYYGAIDHWCPVSYYEDMKRDYADVDLRLCKNNFKHAFVLRESEEMAVIVAEMVKDFKL